MSDIRQAIRVFLKRPGFSAVVVLTLALGIGANTAIFSVTDKLLLRSLPVRDPDQLVLITSVSVKPHFVSNSFSYPVFNDYRTQNNVFDGLLAFNRTELELTSGAGTESGGAVCAKTGPIERKQRSATRRGAARFLIGHAPSHAAGASP